MISPQKLSFLQCFAWLIYLESSLTIRAHVKCIELFFLKLRKEVRLWILVDDMQGLSAQRKQEEAKMSSTDF